MLLLVMLFFVCFGMQRVLQRIDDQWGLSPPLVKAARKTWYNLP